MNFLLERSKLEESEISCLSDTIDRRERLRTSSMVYKELGQKA